MHDCKKIKQEYESLQTHAAEFALTVDELRAEERVGRALNREMFNAAKLAKKELAEARDVLLGKLRYVRFSANYVSEKGVETIEIDLEKELALYREFYKRNKIHWIKLPDHISVDTKTKKQMIKLIETTGMNWLAIIPDGLTGEPDDEKLKKTLGKSIDDLEEKGGLFETWGVSGLTEAEYLIFQRRYFEETNKHLDETRWTWLAASRRPRSGRVPGGSWDTDLERLDFHSDAADHRSASQGCRLAGSFLL